MNDERAIEVIANYLVAMEFEKHLAYAKVTAADILAELREAGLEVVSQ